MLHFGRKRASKVVLRRHGVTHYDTQVNEPSVQREDMSRECYSGFAETVRWV